MQEYIVHPLFFYLLQLSEGFKSFIWIVAIIAGIIAILFFWYGIDNSNEDYIKRGRKRLIIAIILYVISLFVPKKQTLLEMEIARHATYENVNMIIESTQNAADYILNKIKNEEE